MIVDKINVLIFFVDVEIVVKLLDPVNIFEDFLRNFKSK